MAEKIYFEEPRKCVSCGITYSMEDIELSPQSARHRLRFRNMKTCGKELCKRKAMASRSISKRRIYSRRKAKEYDDVETDCQQHLTAFLRNSIPDLIDGLPKPGPDFSEYFRMMGRNYL